MIENTVVQERLFISTVRRESILQNPFLHYPIVTIRYLVAIIDDRAEHIAKIFIFRLTRNACTDIILSPASSRESRDLLLLDLAGI